MDGGEGEIIECFWNYLGVEYLFFGGEGVVDEGDGGVGYVDCCCLDFVEVWNDFVGEIFLDEGYE